MKILVDIIHPANVHYFKNFIFSMKDKGHKIIITSRNKDVSHELLKAYDLIFYSMGKGSIGGGALGKGLYLIYQTFVQIYFLIRFKPDYVISFASSPCAVASKLLKIPHITFDDTEHAKLNRKIYASRSDMVVTPECFYEDAGKNHFRFKGYMELFYLHKNKFTPDKDIKKLIGVDDEPYVIVRFVSWGAFHDIGEKGIADEEKIKIIRELEKYAKVFISSESKLPEHFEKYRLNVPAEKMHDVLAFSKMYIGEGGTMASECAMLGIPSIYINSLPLMGYLQKEEDSGLLYHLDEYKEIIDTINKIMNTDRQEFIKMKNEFLKDCIDPTEFLIWLIENYPKSREKLIENISYQERFK